VAELPAGFDPTKLIAIVGSTGTGKSELALKLAERLESLGQPCAIINCDSMQFYKGMNVGTAKLSVAERRGVRHELLDWLEVTDDSTAAGYQAVARPLIQRLQAEGVTPIMVGGSMLYVAAVLNTFEFPGNDEVYRAKLEADLVEHGPHEMHRRLKAIDPVAASRIIVENGRRTVRALEIIHVTGQPFAAALPDEVESWQPVVEIGLTGDRDDLRARLEQRVHLMWQNGLLDEVRALEKNGLRAGKTASRAIGYSQALAQLDGEMSEADAIADTVRLTQKYARRQISWFKRDPRINWLDYADPTNFEQALKLVGLSQ
jgi:tRNA dimethylallyltransferase